MTTLDAVATGVAALVAILVCVAVVARTRDIPATSRTVVVLGVTAGLSALIAVLGVNLVAVAGHGDPFGAARVFFTTSADVLTRPLTLSVVALAAVAGAIVGWVRWRASAGAAT